MTSKRYDSWFDGKRFYNQYSRAPRQWRADKEYRSLPKAVHFKTLKPDLETMLGAIEPQVCWLGHASFFLSVAGKAILTDPVFSERCAPVQWLGPKRSQPSPIQVDDLPQVDIVFISHNHYDHLDENTVLKLAERFSDAVYVVPQGLKAWFEKRGFEHVLELQWWQKAELMGLHVQAVPAQHFSGRGIHDRNKTHWCGFVVREPELNKVFYFAGDTGYAPIFKEIHAAQEHAIDLGLIPIGAYEPRGIARAVHVNPDEAVKIHLDLAIRKSIAMHWGVFRLTTEPMQEPPVKLQQAKQLHGVEDEAFIVMEQGEVQPW